uniref:Amiloride-sensitive sodium channel n=1 Tax=Macrostomum lignano TaxID=282301 RepID=A0A1I8IQL9_9PLAT
MDRDINKSSDRYRRRVLFANIHSFASRTSAHGLSRFFSQQIPWLRLLWIVVVMGALTGLTMHTYKQISLFRDYPVSSTTRLLTNKFTFPDVTICDPLMKKFLRKQSSDLRRSNESILNYFVLSYMMAMQFANNKNSNQSDEAISVQATKMAYASFEHAVHTWPIFNMTEVSARMLDMLVFCQYNQETCSEKDFKVFYHRDYGNCFSFKPHNRLMKSSGVEKGLVLVLYSPSVDHIQNNDWYSNIVTTGLETGGLRVVVHQKDTIPYPSEYGINSPSGMQTVLALNQVQTSLANTPTKQCEPRTRFHAYDHILGNTQSYEKQLTDCTTFEHMKRVRDKCNCTIEGPVPTETYGSGERRINFCHDIMGAQNPERTIKLIKNMVEFLRKNRNDLINPRNNQLNMLAYNNLPMHEKQAISAALEHEFHNEVKQRLKSLRCALPELRSGRSQSKCLNMCKYTTYDFSVFQSRWPDLSLEIRLRVYPKTLTVRQLFEERSYELVNLFSDLGGIMGLWIGVSMVTLCEFAEIILIILSYNIRALLAKLPSLTRSRRACGAARRETWSCVAEAEGQSLTCPIGCKRPGELAASIDSRQSPSRSKSYDHSVNPNLYRQPRLLTGNNSQEDAAIATVRQLLQSGLRGNTAGDPGNGLLNSSTGASIGKETRL